MDRGTDVASIIRHAATCVQHRHYRTMVRERSDQHRKSKYRMMQQLRRNAITASAPHAKACVHVRNLRKSRAHQQTYKRVGAGGGRRRAKRTKTRECREFLLDTALNCSTSLTKRLDGACGERTSQEVACGDIRTQNTVTRAS